ncbi:MAG: hypothetical protein E7167_02710 [Firmicutes bacterium]|nr:hypothetical protein [Bacillota bacterium]
MLKENYKDLIPDNNSWLLPRENGMLLSDYHIEVLKRNGIDYMKYGSITQILFDINDILDEEENEELESVARELDERNYYNKKKN